MSSDLLREDMLHFFVQGILTDQALKLLVDSTWTSLDLSFSTVSNASLQEALQSLPNLLVLDISGCKFQPRTLQMLGKHCPQLQILRLGMSGPRHQSKGAGAQPDLICSQATCTL